MLIRMFSPELPLIDEEYTEHIYVFHSVYRARTRKTFVMAELGARWGTWGARAIGLWRRLSENPYDVLFVESDRLHCDALTRVQLLNNFSYELRCEDATVELMSEWLHRREHVDLIDIDIQGAELDLLRGIKHKLDKHVQRIIVGTHSKEIHETPCQLFSDWIILHDSKPAKDTACIVNLLRRNYDESKAHSFEWDEILSTGCFQDSEFGPICNWDGELILDNPAFVTA